MDIGYKEVKTISEFIDAVRLRVEVFIVEMGFQPGWEPDEADKESRHFIAIADGKVVSTARFREESSKKIKIERMATKKEYRGKGIGKELVKLMLKEIMKNKPKKIWATCYAESERFWEDCGFQTISKPYERYGFKHVDMEYQKK